MSKRLVRRQGVLVKIESSDGADASPGATDAVRMAGPGTLTIGAEIENARASVITQSLDLLAPLAPSAKFGELAFDVELRGAGSAYAAGVKPELDAILRAAGTSATLVTTPSSESWTYDTASASLETVSAYFQLDGKQWKLLGARANVAFSARAGAVGMARVTLRGILTIATDTALVSGTFQTTVPPTFKGATYSYNAVTTLIVREFGCDLGNAISARPSAVAADALAGYMITSRASSASLTCEDPLVATANFESDWSAGTSRVVAIAYGATQYNRAKFDFDRFTVTGISFGDDSGLATATINGVVSSEGTNRFRVRYD